MPISLSPRTGEAGLLLDGLEVVTIGATGITAGLSDALALTKAKTSLNATGDAPMFACRAWVNFNGTGTVAIMASGNVSSITDNGVGNYTINFINSIQDTNYATVATASVIAATYTLSAGVSNQSVSSCNVYTWESFGGGAFTDGFINNIAILR